MAMAAQRYKFLDKETNVGTLNFSGLTDNAVYTGVTDAIDDFSSMIRGENQHLKGMNGSISETMSAVNGASPSIMEKIKAALNSAIERVMNMKFPPFVQRALDKLKGLNLSGVKVFLKNAIKVGSVFLCNNLDLLKNFMLGYSLSRNILSGLLLGLLLSWLDHYCKGFTKEEVYAANNRSRLGMLVDGPSTITTPDIVGLFSNNIADFLRSNRTYDSYTPQTPSSFVSSVTGGANVRSTVASLRRAELTSSQKRQYLAAVNDELPNHTVGTPEYIALLEARGALKAMPIISQERVERNTQYSNVNDNLGVMALGLKDVDLDAIDAYSLSPVEASLLEKLKTFKANVMASQDLQARSAVAGSFDDFDFDSVMPTFTQEELDHIATLPGNEDAGRFNGIHPTSEVFIEQVVTGTPNRRPNASVDTGRTPHGSGFNRLSSNGGRPSNSGSPSSLSTSGVTPQMYSRYDTQLPGGSAVQCISAKCGKVIYLSVGRKGEFDYHHPYVMADTLGVAHG